MGRSQDEAGRRTSIDDYADRNYDRAADHFHSAVEAYDAAFDAIDCPGKERKLARFAE